MKRGGKFEKIRQLVVPECDLFCPIEKFVVLSKTFMPDGLKTCGLHSGNSKHQINVMMQKRELLENGHSTGTTLTNQSINLKLFYSILMVFTLFF